MATAATSVANEDVRVQSAMDQIRSVLIPGESIHAYAVQRRLFALIHRRSIVCATTGRFIGVTRGAFGGFDPQDFRWQDVKDARIRIGIFGADLAIVAFTSPDLAVTGTTTTLSFTGLRIEQAQAVYRVCQAQEQAWREKRRVRELEELRAKSGGIQFDPTAGVASAPQSAAVRLQEAKDMLEKGLITDSEFESLKARIVSSL